MPGKGTMVSVGEAVDLAMGVGVDDIDGILTGGHKNLRVGVKVQRDHPLLLLHRAHKLLTRDQWVMKLHALKIGNNEGVE